MVSRMLLGDLNRNVDRSRAKILKFSDKEFSFNLIVTYLAYLYGFIGLVELYKADDGGPRVWAMTDVAEFDANVCGARIVWSPHHVIEPMVHNAWPKFVEFEFFRANAVSNGYLELGVLKHYLFGIGQAMVTNFFEEQKGKLRTKYGDRRDWPDVWRFSWVLRNAMAHGGRIRIDDNSSVNWKGLSYSKEDNGREINNDIWTGDLFFLMKEMEEYIK